MYYRKTHLALLLALSAAGALLGTSTAHADTLAGKSDQFLTRQAAHSKRGWSQVIVRFEGALTRAQEAQLHALGADITVTCPSLNRRQSLCRRATWRSWQRCRL